MVGGGEERSVYGLLRRKFSKKHLVVWRECGNRPSNTIERGGKKGKRKQDNKKSVAFSKPLSKYTR